MPGRIIYVAGVVRGEEGGTRGRRQVAFLRRFSRFALRWLKWRQAGVLSQAWAAARVGVDARRVEKVVAVVDLSFTRRLCCRLALSGEVVHGLHDVDPFVTWSANVWRGQFSVAQFVMRPTCLFALVGEVRRGLL